VTNGFYIPVKLISPVPQVREIHNFNADRDFGAV
jgi:hypothetical protein